jgi:hypothetical protein
MKLIEYLLTFFKDEIMNKKLFFGLLIGLLVCGGLAFAQESVSASTSVENQTPQKIRQARISLQWNYEAKSTKEALETNKAYLTKVNEIAKKYKMTLKETSNSYSIADNQNSGYKKASNLQVYYTISTTFDLDNIPINTIIPEFDVLQYSSIAYDEYDGFVQ